jgi:histidinol-phosphate/aromatic aminotransferase/cobyric acid decarboxylase-like protein
MSFTVSRRSFLGGFSAAVGTLTAGTTQAFQTAGAARPPRARLGLHEYDAAAKLAFNENPYGPSEAVMKAMTAAFKYDNRYGYPDGNLVQSLAEHHGVRPDNLLLGAGSGEILQVVGRAFLGGGRKVVGVTPTFGTV